MPSYSSWLRVFASTLPRPASKDAATRDREMRPASKPTFVQAQHPQRFGTLAFDQPPLT